MEYELAKQLKDAGFPQDGTGKYIHDESNPPVEIYDPKKDAAPSYSKDSKQWVKVPTLEELIKACDTSGDITFTLTNTTLTVRWHASMSGFGGNGATPTEAVARLWLALNKKI